MLFSVTIKHFFPHPAVSRSLWAWAGAHKPGHVHGSVGLWAQWEKGRMVMAEVWATGDWALWWILDLSLAGCLPSLCPGLGCGGGAHLGRWKGHLLACAQ